MNPLKELTQQWLDAFNEHDLEKLVALYDENATHYSPKLKIHRPETNGFIQGKTALRIWWADAFERLPKLHYSLLKLTAENDQVFLEYIRKTPDEPDLQVGEVLQFKEHKIIFSRVYHS